MSFTKRPRSIDEPGSSSTEVVVISSDEEEPSRKRQRSISRAQNGLSQRAEPLRTKIGTPQHPYLPSNSGTIFKNYDESIGKKPPWKSSPLWRLKGATNAKTVTSKALPTESTPNVNSNLKEDSDRSSIFERAYSIEDLVIIRKYKTKDSDTIADCIRRAQKEGYLLPEKNHGRDSTSEETAPLIGELSQQPSRSSPERDNRFKFGSATALKFNTESNDRVKPSKPLSNGYSQVKSSSTPEQGPKQPARWDPTVSRPDPPKPPPQVAVNIPFHSVLHESVPRGLEISEQSDKGPNRAPNHASRFSVELPLSEETKQRRAKRALQEKLKLGVEYVGLSSEEIEKVLGLTGLSITEFPLNLDQERFKNAAQPKKRNINRSNVGLDVGTGASPQRLSWDPSDIGFIHPSSQAKAVMIDRFSQGFSPPLTFSNAINDRRLNGKFQFISEYVLRRGVKATGYIGQPGCKCIPSCDLACLCLRKTFKEDKPKRERIEQVPQYRRRRDGLVVLRDDFIERYKIQWGDNDDLEPSQERIRVEITECNDACLCDSSCTNRVVQKGRTVPLDIFETARCGFGVRSSQDLVRGQFIELYLGEVVTEGELLRREEAAEAGSTSYIYSLDWFSQQQPYHIDGENFGSAMRFVNHSCDPNAGTFTVLNNRSTKQLHHVAFFAIKDIPAGTEITIDYTPQAAGETYELRTADEGMEKCYCGSKNCRRMLWLPGKERKARKRTVGRSFD